MHIESSTSAGAGHAGSPTERGGHGGETTGLPAPAALALDAVWARTIRDGAPAASRSELRSAARDVAAGAKAAGMLVEALLVAVKASWQRHEERRSTVERSMDRWVLAEMISLCIDEYYGETRAARDPGSTDGRA